MLGAVGAALAAPVSARVIPTAHRLNLIITSLSTLGPCPLVKGHKLLLLRHLRFVYINDESITLSISETFFFSKKNKSRLDSFIQKPHKFDMELHKNDVLSQVSINNWR